MTLDPALLQRIQATLDQHPVVLFMKGSPAAPRCGFSAKASGILSGLLESYCTVDVLEDAEIREGIKAFGNWPTIPQLYVKGELVGGSDIIESMLNDGQLHSLFGLPAPDRSPPTLKISEQAAAMIRNALEDAGDGIGLHMSVDPAYNAQFQLKPIQGNEIVAEAGGIRFHFDLASAPRARGVEIDWVESARGAGLAVKNPNAPAEVRQLPAAQLPALLAEGATVIDVRSEYDRNVAPFPGPHEVLDEDSVARLSALPKDTPLAFLCHHGNSSLRAAEHFRGLGFSRVFNIEGGIDAYARDVDSSIRRY